MYLIHTVNEILYSYCKTVGILVNMRNIDMVFKTDICSFFNGKNLLRNARKKNNKQTNKQTNKQQQQQQNNNNTNKIA